MESERVIERGYSDQEKDSDQPRQIEELVPKTEATSVVWTRFEYERFGPENCTLPIMQQCVLNVLLSGYEMTCVRFWSYHASMSVDCFLSVCVRVMCPQYLHVLLHFDVCTLCV